MVAARDLKDAPGVGKYAFFNVFHPCSIYTHRDRVLSLARHRAGVASDAFTIIDYEAVFHLLED
jgi:hypothetical protein